MSGAQDIWSRLPPTLTPLSTAGTTEENRDHHIAEDDEHATTPSADSHMSLEREQSPLRDPRAARYLKFFVYTITPWIDICDPARHFATEVPRRAAENPLIAYAVLAYASRQLALLTGIEDTICEAYYARALRILIPLLDDPVQALSENTFIGIVILRLYEERAETYTEAHLLGSARVLTLANSFATQGGLGEAASWLVLRQNFHASIIMAKPLRLDLTHFSHSSSFLSSHDESFANRAVLLCARVMSCTLWSGSHLSLQSWNRLNEDACGWYDSLPPHFRPYYTDIDTFERNGRSPFPVMLMSRPPQVLAYQELYIARLLLALFDPRQWPPGLNAFRQRKLVERNISIDLRAVLGLAISNPSVITSSITAYQTLFAFGWLLYESRDQEATMEFLYSFHSRTGLPVAPLIERLREEWLEMT